MAPEECCASLRCSSFPGNHRLTISPEAGLKVKDDLDIEVRKGALVLRPHLRRVYRLEDLVKRMTPRNMHKEIDFGGPVGREAL